MRSAKVAGGDAGEGVVGDGEPDRGEVWTMGCGCETDGGPATRRRRRREGQGCAGCLRGMAGIKDGLGILTSVLVSTVQHMQNDES